MDYLIGIDLGTSTTKAVLFEKNGTIAASASQAYSLHRDASGMAEEELEDIFAALIKTVHTVAEQLKPQDQVLALSFSTQMHALIAFDEAWQPLTRVITWADTRAAAYANQLKASKQGLALYQRTGTPLHPMSPLAKVLWLKNEQSAIYQTAAHYLELKGYLFHRLFGSNKIDLSSASGMGLFNNRELTWDSEALSLTGLRPDQLPEVVEPYEIEQGLSPELAQQMGLQPDTPFVWGAADGPLSNLGVNAIKPGVAALTIGTSGAIRVMIDRPRVDPQARTFTYALDRTHWLVGGPVNSGGDVLRWLREAVFHNEVTFAELTELAAQAPAGSAGLLFHPYLGGERAPLWNADARASFFGLNYSHDRRHLARSVLEGIIFNLHLVAQSLEEVVGELKLLQATGGFTNSALWLQILADIFNQPIEVAPHHEAGCFAAMLMAQKALGLIEELELVDSLSEKGQIYQPNPENVAIYRQLEPIYQHLLQDFSQDYQALADFQKNFK